MQGLAEGLTKGRAEGLTKGRGQGLAEGRGQGLARAVLQVLRARGITVTRALRQRIVSCSDVRQLTDWTRRAAVATSADDLFAST